MLTKLDEIMAEIETESYFMAQSLKECTIRTDFLLASPSRIPDAFIEYVIEGNLLFEKRREIG